MGKLETEAGRGPQGFQAFIVCCSQGKGVSPGEGVWLGLTASAAGKLDGLEITGSETAAAILPLYPLFITAMPSGSLQRSYINDEIAVGHASHLKISDGEDRPGVWAISLTFGCCSNQGIKGQTEHSVRG